MGVFISYRREDSAGYAGRLHEELQQRLGSVQVFRDLDSLYGGQDFVDTINARLQHCGAVVAVIGRDWLNARTAAGALRLDQPDDFVALEIAAALKRPDVLVVPVLVDGATMPASSQLPERIRALARRHALTLRDETWETDVDRLTTVLTRSTTRNRAFSRPTAAAVATVAVVLVAAFLLLRDGGSDGSGSGQGASSPAAPAAPVTGPYALDIPGLSEIEHRRVIYTLISGGVFPRGGTNGVRLRFRLSNEGFDDANVGDDSFRLVIGNEVLAPTGGLNEIVPGRSIRQAIVTFTAPVGSSRSALRILSGSDTADLPIDLSPTGRPVEDEKADAGDALSRARLALVMREPVPLVDENGFSATLLRVTSRLFVNKRRLNVGVRMKNDGRDPVHTGVLTLRLADGNAVSEPVIAPNDAVEPGSTLSGDFVFEIPPSSRKIALRASTGNDSAQVPLEVR